MRKNKTFFILLIAGFFIVLVSYGTAEEKGRKELSKNINLVELEERSVFFEAIQKYPKQMSQDKILAAVAPHHLLAADLIAESLSLALGSQPASIILVGPNHSEAGAANFISSDYAWQTDLGNIEADTELLRQLQGAGFLKLDNGVVKKDHACFNLLPFIKHYSPESRVLPILISSKVGLAELEKFANYLHEKVKTDYLIISSIDFSHYLSADVARKKDKETLELVSDFYLEKIFSLTNDHLDCPACLALPMMISDKKEGEGFRLIKNTNSGLLTNNYNAETTSYITGFFPHPEK